MAKPTKNRSIPSTDEAWDVGDLGRDPSHARVSTHKVDESKIDESVGLTPVSIRLQKSLIEDFRFIAELNGIGYQTLMRQVLTRFAECEKKRILREVATTYREEQEAEDPDGQQELKRA